MRSIRAGIPAQVPGASGWAAGEADWRAEGAGEVARRSAATAEGQLATQGAE